MPLRSREGVIGKTGKSHGLSRRGFLKSAGTFGALAGLELLVPGWTRRGLSAASRRTAGTAPITYDLNIAETPLRVGCRRSTATAINGTVPGPLLHFREGDEAVIRVTNALDEDTSVHWHGILVPPEMDGVPGVSFPGIRPGETFEYRFPIKQYGTYWYHSHSAFQEQLGHYGPLIIEPAEGYPYAFDREYVIMLADWTFMDPSLVLDRLKKQPDYFQQDKRTVFDFIRDVADDGLGAAIRDRLMWGRMRMNPTDISDITGSTYTFLVNGQAPDTNWTALFRPGERVLLRFINAAAATFFDVRIPGLPMNVVQVSGQFVQPVETDEFRIAIAETYDVVVHPTEDRAYTIFAEAMDRSGYARGTLATREGMTAPVPDLREPPELTMADMGMQHGEMDAAHEMDHGGASGLEGSDSPPGGGANGMHRGQKASGTAPADSAHGAHPTPAAAPADTAHAMPPRTTRSTNGGHQGHDMSPAPDLPPGAERVARAGAVYTTGLRPPGSVPEAMRHERDRHGPGNAGVPEMVRSRLHEPGVGLGHDGWRVLVYTDLRALHPRPDFRAPDREIELHLTGNMERFMWSINGKRFGEDDPIRLNYGERLRLTMVNDTMMNHPMHLHGMWMELENGHGELIPRVHTVNVQPAERLSLLVTVDASGRWAFHCHILYHMDAGMFQVVEVPEPGTAEVVR